MEAPSRDSALQMWSVDEGVLIARYALATGAVERLSYWLSDERAKATRWTVDFAVEEFDPESRVMELRLSAQAEASDER